MDSTLSGRRWESKLNKKTNISSSTSTSSTDNSSYKDPITGHVINHSLLRWYWHSGKRWSDRIDDDEFIHESSSSSTTTTSTVTNLTITQSATATSTITTSSTTTISTSSTTLTADPDDNDDGDDDENTEKKSTLSKHQKKKQAQAKIRPKKVFRPKPIVRPIVRPEHLNPPPPPPPPPPPQLICETIEEKKPVVVDEEPTILSKHQKKKLLKQKTKGSKKKNAKAGIIVPVPIEKEAEKIPVVAKQQSTTGFIVQAPAKSRKERRKESKANNNNNQSSQIELIHSVDKISKETENEILVQLGSLSGGNNELPKDYLSDRAFLAPSFLQGITAPMKKHMEIFLEEKLAFGKRMQRTHQANRIVPTSSELEDELNRCQSEEKEDNGRKYHQISVFRYREKLRYISKRFLPVLLNVGNRVVRWFIQLLNEDFLLQTAAANITSHMNNHHEHMMRLEEHIGRKAEMLKVHTMWSALVGRSTSQHFVAFFPHVYKPTESEIVKHQELSRRLVQLAEKNCQDLHAAQLGIPESERKHADIDFQDAVNAGKLCRAMFDYDDPPSDLKKNIGAYGLQSGDGENKDRTEALLKVPFVESVQSILVKCFECSVKLFEGRATDQILIKSKCCVSFFCSETCENAHSLRVNNHSKDDTGSCLQIQKYMSVDNSEFTGGPRSCMYCEHSDELIIHRRAWLTYYITGFMFPATTLSAGRTTEDGAALQPLINVVNYVVDYLDIMADHTDITLFSNDRRETPFEKQKFLPTLSKMQAIMKGNFICCDECASIWYCSATCRDADRQKHIPKECYMARVLKKKFLPKRGGLSSKDEKNVDLDEIKKRLADRRKQLKEGVRKPLRYTTTPVETKVSTKEKKLKKQKTSHENTIDHKSGADNHKSGANNNAISDDVATTIIKSYQQTSFGDTIDAQLIGFVNSPMFRNITLSWISLPNQNELRQWVDKDTTENRRRKMLMCKPDVPSFFRSEFSFKRLNKMDMLMLSNKSATQINSLVQILERIGDTDGKCEVQIFHQIQSCFAFRSNSEKMILHLSKLANGPYRNTVIDRTRVNLQVEIKALLTQLNLLNHQYTVCTTRDIKNDTVLLRDVQKVEQSIRRRYLQDSVVLLVLVRLFSESHDSNTDDVATEISMPTFRSKFPCGYCARALGYSAKARVVCSACQVVVCSYECETEYKHLHHDDISCPRKKISLILGVGMRNFEWSKHLYLLNNCTRSPMYQCANSTCTTDIYLMIRRQEWLGYHLHELLSARFQGIKVATIAEIQNDCCDAEAIKQISQECVSYGMIVECIMMYFDSTDFPLLDELIKTLSTNKKPAKLIQTPYEEILRHSLLSTAIMPKCNECEIVTYCSPKCRETDSKDHSLKCQMLCHLTHF